MRPIKLFILYALILGTPLLFVGCPPALTPETKEKIQQQQQQTAIAKETVKSQADIAAAKAKADAQAKISAAEAKAALARVNGSQSPTLHPYAATNNLAVELHPWLLAGSLLFGAGWAVTFGLRRAGFALLGWLEPAFRMLAIVSGVALVSVPLLPIGALFIFSTILVLFVYEIVRHKGNIPAAITAAEEDVGLKSPPKP